MDDRLTPEALDAIAARESIALLDFDPPGGEQYIVPLTVAERDAFVAEVRRLRAELDLALRVSATARDVAAEKYDECEALTARLTALAERWEAEPRGMHTGHGHIRHDEQRKCAAELRRVLGEMP